MKDYLYDYNEEELKSSFGKSLKKIRDYTKFTLKDIEKLTGISNSLISRYENQKVEPSITQAILIANVFLLEVEDFIFAGLHQSEMEDEIIHRFFNAIKEFVRTTNINGKKLLQKVFEHVDIEKILIA